LALLIKTTRSFLGLVSKAKAAKLVRTLVDLFLDMEAGTGDEVNHFSFVRFFPTKIIYSGFIMSRKYRMGKK
jgi:hypothetical protein